MDFYHHFILGLVRILYALFREKEMKTIGMHTLKS
jgi:hypothetical protein